MRGLTVEVAQHGRSAPPPSARPARSASPGFRAPRPFRAFRKGSNATSLPLGFRPG
jgi:hypothetical protein